MGEYADDAIDQGINDYLRGDYDDEWDEEFYAISCHIPPSENDLQQKRQQCLAKMPPDGSKVILHVPDWLCYRKRWQPGRKIGRLVSTTSKAILINRNGKEHWLPLAYIRILKSE